MNKIDTTKFSNNGIGLLKILLEKIGDDVRFTKNQIDKILSLQFHIKNIKGKDIFIKGKKKRGGKLNKEKFMINFFKNGKK